VTQRDADVGLACSAHACDEQTLATANEIESRKLHDTLAVEPGLEAKVEVVEGLRGGEPRGFDPSFDASLSPGVELRLQQSPEEFETRVVLFGADVELSLKRCSHVVELQL